MNAADASAVALVVSRALAVEDGREPPVQPVQSSVDGWVGRLEQPRKWFFVRCVQGRVVGICHGAPEWDAERDAPRGDVGHLTGLFVEPEMWGRGYGRELLRAGMARMAALGAGSAKLWTAVGNERADRLYASEGWRPTGRDRIGLDGRAEVELTVGLRTGEAS